MLRMLFRGVLLGYLLAGCRKDGKEQCFRYEETRMSFAKSRDTGRAYEVIPVAVEYRHHNGCLERGYVESSAEGNVVRVRAYKKILECWGCTQNEPRLLDTLAFRAERAGIYYLTSRVGGYGNLVDTVVVE